MSGVVLGTEKVAGGWNVGTHSSLGNCIYSFIHSVSGFWRALLPGLGSDWGWNGTGITAKNLMSFPLPVNGAGGLGTPMDGGAVFARKSTGDQRWQGDSYF